MAWDKIGDDIIAAPLTQFEVTTFPADHMVLLRLEAPPADGPVMGFQVAMHPDLASRLAKALERAAKDVR